MGENEEQERKNRLYALGALRRKAYARGASRALNGLPTLRTDRFSRREQPSVVDVYLNRPHFAAQANF